MTVIVIVIETVYGVRCTVYEDWCTVDGCPDSLDLHLHHQHHHYYCLTGSGVGSGLGSGSHPAFEKF